MKKRFPILLSLLSGILLFLSFAPCKFAFLGWVAFIPLFIVCADSTPRRAMQLGWLAGTAFYLTTFFWIRHVSWMGFFALSFYCALYWIPFALFVSLRTCSWRSTHGLKNLVWIGGGAAVWTGSEYLRGILFSGFVWNDLGVSQVAQLPIIQIAEVTGVYGISFVMMFVNLAIGVTFLQYASKMRSRKYKMHLELMIAFVLVALLWSFGMHSLLDVQSNEKEIVKTALIQTNLAEVGNWQLPDPEEIYKRLNELTELAAHSGDLDLVIWPETILPDCLRYSAKSANFVKRLSALGSPILVGTMDAKWRNKTKCDYFNSTMLISTKGTLLESYDKQHLVIFGEYIPFEGKIPFVNALTPINSSYAPGERTTLFRLPNQEQSPFSVLICFEDTLPYLARRAAHAGATWLVVQTNDSWFDPDCGSDQHLANSVFRAIETRLPMVRCANTGITCSIDSFGRVTQTLPPREKGFQVAQITPASIYDSETFYVRFGDWFAQACVLASVTLFVLFAFKRRRCSNA